MKKTILGLGFFWLLLGPLLESTLSYGASDDSLKFEINLAAGMDRFVDLLPYPPYLFLAYENLGKKISNSGKILVEDSHTAKLERQTAFPFKEAKVAFTEKRGDIFSYLATVRWEVVGAKADFNIKIELDTSRLKNQQIVIRV